MLIQQSRQFILSEHARERLAERSKLSESELLELLENEAFRRIHVRLKSDLTQGQIDLYIREYGISFQEMKRHGMVKVKAVFEHLLVWSCSDGKPLTIIVAINDGTIVTILNSDDFSQNDWSDKVTENTLSDVQARAEKHRFPDRKVYVMHVRWLDMNGIPKHKTFNKPKITCVGTLVPSLEDLEQLARSHVANGRDIRLTLRNKKDLFDIFLDKSLDATGSEI